MPALSYDQTLNNGLLRRLNRMIEVTKDADARSILMESRDELKRLVDIINKPGRMMITRERFEELAEIEQEVDRLKSKVKQLQHLRH